MKITFVHIVEQIQFEPQTALLAAVVKASGHEASRVATDFGTRQEILTRTLEAEAPDLLAIRVTGEMREAVTWSLAELRKSCPDLPLLLYGTLAEDAPDDLAGIADPALLLSDEAEMAMFNLLAAGTVPEASKDCELPKGVGLALGGEVRWGESLPASDPSLAPPPDFGLFGAPTFFGRGTGCSFFGDVGTALIEASIGTPRGMPANAALRIFNYPTNKEARGRPAQSVLSMIDSLPPEVTRVDFADREFGWMSDAEELLLGLADRRDQRTFTVRVLAETCNLDFLATMAARGVERVVLEMDVANAKAAARLSGGQSPKLVSKTIKKIQSLGMTAGLLVSVGLPFESPADIDEKLRFIQDHDIDNLRFLPFEPRIGHPWRQICAEEGMLPVGDGAWNRETYTPLTQASMDAESWHQAWQRCLDLQARIAISS